MKDQTVPIDHPDAEIVYDLKNDPGWSPEVLEGADAVENLPADFDLSEVWYWFHSRLKMRGSLGHDNARLTALLNWNEETLQAALHAARLHVNQLPDSEAKQAHMEFLTADYLARQLLEEESIPSPELRPA